MIFKKKKLHRKELVLGEDFKESAKPEKITDLYGGVSKIIIKCIFIICILMLLNGAIYKEWL